MIQANMKKGKIGFLLGLLVFFDKAKYRAIAINI